MSTRAIRIHVEALPASGEVVALPEGAARHAQVRRVQPGDALQLFDGRGREHLAHVTAMGRREVTVVIGAALPTLPELPLAVTLALGVPANERMDTLVEKATELGVAAIQPLWTERAVLRLEGERAERRRAHWQAVAVAASEQSGRAIVPEIAPPRPLGVWLEASKSSAATVRWMLDFADDALWPAEAARAVKVAQVAKAADAVDAAEAAEADPSGLAADAGGSLVVLSGPEGGLSSTEREAARRAGFQPISLGPRVLRADTAPLALLAWLGLRG